MNKNTLGKHKNHVLGYNLGYYRSVLQQGEYPSSFTASRHSTENLLEIVKNRSFEAVVILSDKFHEIVNKRWCRKWIAHRERLGTYYDNQQVFSFYYTFFKI